LKQFSKAECGGAGGIDVKPLSRHPPKKFGPSGKAVCEPLRLSALAVNNLMLVTSLELKRMKETGAADPVLSGEIWFSIIKTLTYLSIFIVM
jgi:hypothetical protein